LSGRITRQEVEEKIRKRQEQTERTKENPDKNDSSSKVFVDEKTNEMELE
jgi:hypothetical protein